MNGFQEALKQACAIAGVDVDGARLLRLGSNAVYRLKDPVVARVSRPGADIDLNESGSPDSSYVS